MGKFHILRLTEGIFIVLESRTDRYLGNIQWATYSGLIWYMDRFGEVIHTSTGNWPQNGYDTIQERMYKNLEEFYG